MNDINEIFKILSDNSKLEIIKLIYKSQKELCVNEISEKVNLSQSNTSHKLSKLRDKDILENIPMGNLICYKLKDNKITRLLKKILNTIENENYI